MSELLLLLILAFIFIFTPDTYIGSKYRLSVYLICNNRYRPWKTHIGRPLICSDYYYYYYYYYCTWNVQLYSINTMIQGLAYSHKKYMNLYPQFSLYIFFFFSRGPNQSYSSIIISKFLSFYELIPFLLDLLYYYLGLIYLVLVRFICFI